MKFLALLKEFVAVLRDARHNAEQRQEERRFARYYANKRRYGCGCCDGPPPFPKSPRHRH